MKHVVILEPDELKQFMAGEPFNLYLANGETITLKVEPGTQVEQTPEPSKPRTRRPRQLNLLKTQRKPRRRQSHGNGSETTVHGFRRGESNFDCPYCDRSFVSLQARSTHKTKAHKDKLNQPLV